MSTDFYSRMFERERAEQEAYARQHGYIVNDGNDTHYVYFLAPREHGPLAQCNSRWDAVRIAYALAKTFPKEAKP